MNLKNVNALFLITVFCLVIFTGCSIKETKDETTISTATTVLTDVVDPLFIVENASSELTIEIATIANQDFKLILSKNVYYHGKYYDVTVSWSSSNTDVININGTDATVYRPASGSGDAEVTLTATLSLYGASTLKHFEVIVQENSN